MLCNSLIQPHFYYACSAWYPNLNNKYIKKVQIAQNKCIRFCLFLESRAHIGVNEFHKINWLPTRERFEKRVSVGMHKFCKNVSPSYMSDIFVKNDIRHNTRRSTEMLNIPMKNTNVGQQGPNRVCLILAQNFGIFYHKKINFKQSTNSFKHAVKEDYFKQLQKAENDPFLYPLHIEVSTLNYYNFSYFL